MQKLETRSRAAVIAILFWLAADFGIAVVGAMKVAALGGTGAIWSTAALQQVDRWSTGFGVAYSLTFILSVVFVARWIHRASANAHAVSDAMTISPGWSVGYFFVPVANLLKPFQALRETWQASLSPAAPDSVATPGLLRLWWGLWLLTNVLNNVALRISINAQTISDIVTVGWLDVACFAVNVPLAASLIVVIRQLGANQRALVDTRIFE